MPISLYQPLTAGAVMNKVTNPTGKIKRKVNAQRRVEQTATKKNFAFSGLLSKQNTFFYVSVY